MAEMALGKDMPLETSPGTRTASTTKSPPGISGIVPTARAAAQATINPALDAWSPAAYAAKPRHATSATRVRSDQIDATAKSRRPRLTDSSCVSVSRHFARPVSAGLPRTELNHDKTRHPI